VVGRNSSWGVVQPVGHHTVNVDGEGSNPSAPAKILFKYDVRGCSVVLIPTAIPYAFPGAFCGVPTIVEHYLVQSVPVTHGLIVLDIANAAKPVEVSRLKINDTYFPHWTGWDAKTQRLVLTGLEPRLYLLKLDQATGALTMDDAFHNTDGKAGFSLGDREWPHGWKGTGLPHGVVFCR
jgi:hypothetical protein